ncbi:MAG: MazG-like family protein [Solobacterium sp.]|jgi:NTP pyrophosphatase (non-canonical NTP hydrolase)|nr:MazG-like family protein [Solobacterium sp.]
MMNDVSEFLDRYGLHIDPQSRYIDFVSEAGQLGRAILESTDYGSHTAEMNEAFRDEAGDCLFSLIALISEAGIEPDALLSEVLERYQKRMDAYPGSGE